MREITTITKVYKFNELTPEQKDLAIEKWRKGIDWSYESQSISEDFKYDLGELNYPTEDLEWSLSHCQGDGVAFYGKIGFEDMNAIVNRLEGEEGCDIDIELYNDLSINDFLIYGKIYRNSYGYHYSHYNTMIFELEHDDIDTIVEKLFALEYGQKGFDEKYQLIEKLFENIEQSVQDDIKNVSKKLEKQGYSQIEYVESDIAIIETIEANDYEFLSNGDIY